MVDNSPPCCSYEQLLSSLKGALQEKKKMKLRIHIRFVAGIFPDPKLLLTDPDPSLN